MSRLRIAVSCAVALGLAGVGAAPATAAPKQRIAVVGKNAKVVAAVRKALAGKVELVAARGGAGDAARLAEENGLHGVVTVVVRGPFRNSRAIVSLIEGRSGERVARYVVRGTRRQLPRRAAVRAWGKLRRPILRARAPASAAPEPEPVPEPVTEEAPAPEDDGERTAANAPPPEDDVAGGASAAGDGDAEAGDAGSLTASAGTAKRGAPWIELSAGAATLMRSLRYNDDLDQVLREYDVTAPAIALGATWRPTSRGALRFFALRAAAEIAVGVSGSRTSDGTEYPTSTFEWSAGLRAHVPIRRWAVIVDAGYGEHRFTIDGDGEMDMELLPDMIYRWLRTGVAVRANVTDDIAIEAGGGYRYLLDSGDLDSAMWFPRLTGNGIDARLGGGWRVGGPVVLQVGAELRRYFFAMNPEPGDPVIAGGAVDQYLTFGGGLSVVLR